jgi:hypothetical protein
MRPGGKHLCRRAQPFPQKASEERARAPSVADAHTGAVAAVQRTDGALRLNIHLHVLALDGVYVRDREIA